MKTRKWFFLLPLASLFLLSGCGEFNLSDASKSEETPETSDVGESIWMTDYEAALARAEEEKKPILMNFTGSDWCPPCKMMQKEVLTQKEFLEYAEENLVLLELDYPFGIEQPREIVEQNELLQAEFDIEVFPTFIMLRSDGAESRRVTGYQKGGPSQFISWIGS